MMIKKGLLGPVIPVLVLRREKEKAVSNEARGVVFRLQRDGTDHGPRRSHCERQTWGTWAALVAILAMLEMV
jgi:hypothetical protein